MAIRHVHQFLNGRADSMRLAQEYVSSAAGSAAMRA
jgi:hypothetical protein